MEKNDFGKKGKPNKNLMHFCYSLIFQEHCAAFFAAYEAFLKF
jgi:hypothetical protein